MYLSFCNDLPENLWCNAEDSTMAVLRDSGTGECFRLSGPDPTNDAAFSVLNETTNDGLRITYSGGDANYSFALNIPCNHDTPFNLIGFNLNYNYTTNQTDLEGSFESQFGCEYDQLSQIWNFFADNQWALFALLVISGGLLTFAGRSMLKPTLFIIGVFTTAFIVLYIFYTTFLSQATEQWKFYVTAGVAIFGGLIVGYFLAKFAKVGAFLLAGWGGFTIGIILYNAVFYKVNSSIYMFWGVAVGSGLILGILTIFLYDHILIQSTAIFGSFITVYGIGLVAGHYPNPFTLGTMIENGQFESIDPLYYAYMGGNVLLWILGCVVQYQFKRKNPHYKPEECFRRRYQ